VTFWVHRPGPWAPECTAYIEARAGENEAACPCSPIALESVAEALALSRQLIVAVEQVMAEDDEEP
jgi:hypothetical protein